MGCKQLFVNLGGSGGGGSVNTGVLQIAGGVALDGTLRYVEDQSGTDSVLQLSTGSVGVDGDLQIGTGTLTPNGRLTIKGSGSNILSCRNSSNVEVASISDAGNHVIAGDFTGGGGNFKVNAVGGHGYFTRSSQSAAFVGLWKANSIGTATPSYNSSVLFWKTDGDATYLNTNNAGVIGLMHAGVQVFGTNKVGSDYLINFGGADASYPALKKSSKDIHFKLANDSGFVGITAGRSTEKTLEVTEVSGAMGLGLFNTPAINQVTTSITEGSWTSGGGGTNLKTDDTYAGYTIGQVIQALKNYGLLA